MGQLPTVTDHKGRTWIIDTRLLQIRNADDPHDRVDFEYLETLELAVVLMKAYSNAGSA
jgi:hypothetical protein